MKSTGEAGDSWNTSTERQNSSRSAKPSEVALSEAKTDANDRRSVLHCVKNVAVFLEPVISSEISSEQGHARTAAPTTCQRRCPSTRNHNTLHGSVFNPPWTPEGRWLYRSETCGSSADRPQPPRPHRSEHLLLVEAVPEANKCKVPWSLQHRTTCPTVVDKQKKVTATRLLFGQSGRVGHEWCMHVGVPCAARTSTSTQLHLFTHTYCQVEVCFVGVSVTSNTKFELEPVKCALCMCEMYMEVHTLPHLGPRL